MLLKYFIKLIKRKAQLLMIGDGPDRSKCENLARKLGVYKKVKFLGKLKVIEDLLAITDIFLFLPSQTESFGLVALEAMASTAVVSSNMEGYQK